MIEALNRMPAYRRLVTWQWSHNSIAIDLIRIFIGGALLIRGLAFLSDPELLREFAGPRGMSVAPLVVWTHIGGGLLLALGLFTRIAALIQVPILVVAVFFVHLPGGFSTDNQSLELSALVLVIMAVLMVYGSGKLSLDYRIFYRKLD
ncbi:MAG: putative oxidoreductase [Rhodothermales bacterium]|jgi:putative oxidoreductase